MCQQVDGLWGERRLRGSLGLIQRDEGLEAQIIGAAGAGGLDFGR